MDNLGAWERYQRVAGLCEATITTRLNALRRLEREAGPLDTLTHHGLMDWLGRYSHPATRSTFLSYIRCFYRWATDEQLIDVDPTRRVPKIRTPRRQPRPVSPDVLRQTLAIAPPRERLWIELMAYAGLRVAEVAGCPLSMLSGTLTAPGGSPSPEPRVGTRRPYRCLRGSVSGSLLRNRGRSDPRP